MAKVTFNDKVEDGGTTPEGFATAADLNEIKTVVNANDDNVAKPDQTNTFEEDQVMGAGKAWVLIDESGQKVGAILSRAGKLELVGLTPDDANGEWRAQGATGILQFEQLGIQMQGSEVGNYLYLESEYTDPETGELIYKIGSTPLDVTIYSESYVKTTDQAITDAFVDVVFDTSTILNNSYTGGNAQGVAEMYIENSSNSDAVIEYYLTADDGAPGPNDVFSVTVRRKSGVTNGNALLSLTDTVDSDIIAGAELQMKIRSTVSIAGVDIKATINPGSMRIEEKTGAASNQYATKAAVAKQANPPIDPVTASDFQIILDAATGNAKLVRVRDSVGSAALECFVSGSVTAFPTSGTPTAIPMFQTEVDSSSVQLVKSADDTGVSLNNIPVKVRVDVSFSMEAASNDDFLFAVYANGVKVTRDVQASGRGANKFNNTAFFAFADLSGLIPPFGPVKFELRVWDGGNDIDSISGDMLVSFLRP